MKIEKDREPKVFKTNSFESAYQIVGPASLRTSQVSALNPKLKEEGSQKVKGRFKFVIWDFFLKIRTSDKKISKVSIYHVENN